jgi:hypothetical protein
MQEFLKYLAVMIALVVCYQLYTFSISKDGLIKQKRCQTLGIVYMTIGIFSLVFRTGPTFIGGLVLIMLGFRLIAKGLDRLDKRTFIDQYDEDKDEK